MNGRQSIQAVVKRQSVRQEIKYRIQLNATIDTAQFLLRQGFPFRRHDESESSNNKEFFLEKMRFLGDHNKEIDAVILNNAPQNLKLVAPEIQKDIASACAEETIQEILAELGEELFFVMVDEARDVSTKQQMTVVVRYVNKRGCIVERFLGIVHIFETTSITLKMALEDLFGKHGLVLSRLCGQGRQLS
jgi:aspartate-semialdehyde dehydrogenase